MSITPYNVQAYRDGKWQEVISSELVPGDLVSVCACFLRRLGSNTDWQCEPNPTRASHATSSS